MSRPLAYAAAAGFAVAAGAAAIRLMGATSAGEDDTWLIAAAAFAYALAGVAAALFAHRAAGDGVTTVVVAFTVPASMLLEPVAFLLALVPAALAALALVSRPSAPR